MLRIAQVKTKSGELKFGIVEIATGKCVRKPSGPGWAVYNTKEEATADIESAMMQRERNSW